MVDMPYNHTKPNQKHKFIYIYIYIYTDTDTHTHTHTHTHRQTDTHTHTHIYIYIYIYISSDILKYSQMLSDLILYISCNIQYFYQYSFMELMEKRNILSWYFFLSERWIISYSIFYTFTFTFDFSRIEILFIPDFSPFFYFIFIFIQIYFFLFS